jgi:hypothetical protein
VIVWIAEDFGALVYGKSEIQQFHDLWEVRIKIAFLNGSLQLGQSDPLTFLGGQGLPGPHANQVTLQFRRA